ncbi:hypothetical protein BH09BAC5_BH09BAC5_12600 [soil metagenome]
MKKIHFIIILLSLSIIGCETESGNVNKADSLTKPVVIKTPHEVKKGNGAAYAFKPDTNIQSLILGNPDCFKKYKLNNGANLIEFKKNRFAATYINNSVSINHEMEVLLTKNKNGNYVVYGMIVQQTGDPKSPQLASKAIPSSDFNFISGHGVYVGMSLDYVMSVYSNQSFLQWEKGDTLYLEYKPKPKDVNFYRRFSAESYSILFKFKDERLCRMEYMVEPDQFSK